MADDLTLFAIVEDKKHSRLRKIFIDDTDAVRQFQVFLSGGSTSRIESKLKVLGNIKYQPGGDEHAFSWLDTKPSFSILIIIVVFLPLFSLTGLEGKLFKPMALTITFAMVGSLVLTLTLVPVLSALILKPKEEKDTFLVRWVKGFYLPLLDRGFMATKSIRLDQAMGLFLHAFQSQDAPRFGKFVSTMAFHIERTEGLAEALELVLHVGSVDGAPAIAFGEGASILFRYLQFRVARARRPELLPEIARRWRWEIERLSQPLHRDHMFALRGMALAMAVEGSFSAATVVESMQDAARLENLAIVAGGVLRPAIRVMHQTRRRIPPAQGYRQRCQRQLLRHRRTHRPANQLA